MTGALAHRGPDGRGVWLTEEGPVALGHLALHATPESRREGQPLERREAGLVLVADARIDNREELIGALGLSRAAAPTDAELIMAAFERWGAACADRLIGDFAFALWDERARRLFCARDPMGVKPFYYVNTGRQFAFGTEIKALLRLPGIDDSIDPEQIALFIGWNHEERVHTMYRHVMRLPAAHCMSVSTERTTISRYWSVESSRDVRFSRNEEYVEAFRSIFESAVSTRLRSAHPVGATLSGGLDSSSIVCMSRAFRGQGQPPLHTFSLVFPSLPDKELRLIDERAYVDAVLSGGGVEPHYVRGDELSPLRDAGKILWHLDEPYSTPNLYLHWGMFEAAHESGVRVLLDGFDGDSAVSHGLGRFRGLADARNWDDLETEIRAFSSYHGGATSSTVRQFVFPYLSELARHGRGIAWLRAAAQLRRRLGVSRRDMIVDSGLRPLAPSFILDLKRRLAGGFTESQVLRPSLARKLDRSLGHSARDRLRQSTTERDAHIKGLSHPLYQLTLEIADKSAAAFGVEPRYPFFDRRLIEFCVGIPESQKFGQGWPRHLFRRAMQGILPREIQWRTGKANLSPNFFRRLREVDLSERSVPRSGELARYLDVKRVQEVFRTYFAASSDADVPGYATLLFRATILDLWLDQRTNRGHAARLEPSPLTPAAA